MKKINCSIFVVRLIFIFISIKYSFLDYCNDRSKPILLPSNNECVMKYCTDEDFENNICIKNNSIIRTQWLNNIIQFGDQNCRFPKIVKYSPGEDIVVVCQIFPEKSYSSYFYGLKENGRPLFIKDGKETPYNPLNNYIDSEDGKSNYCYDSEFLMIKKEPERKDYLLKIGLNNDFIELYNFENKDINGEQILFYLDMFISSEKIIGKRVSLFNLEEKNFFMYGGIFCTEPCNSYFLKLYKLSFSIDQPLENSKILINKNSENINLYGNMVSCFETERGAHIFCFYIFSIEDKKYKIIMFDKELNKKDKDYTFSSDIIDENIFFKCFSYIGEKGIFIYYDKGPSPIILFKEKKEEEIKSWDEIDDVKINSYTFNSDLNLNDIIKLNNEAVCFSSVSNIREILYIVMLNFFGKSKLIIRYYTIKIFGLYHYKFYQELRLNTYKQFIALTSSYCNQTDCLSNDIHYSSLIIFSYPNSTDYSKNIIDELFEKNEILENLIFNLSLRDNVRIENNIFGFIYSKIIIKSIESCDTINLNSTTKETGIIVEHILDNNEDIKVTFNNNDLFNCTIGYNYEVTEPDYETFEKYAVIKDTENGEDDEKIFNEQKRPYLGRLSYYSLYLNDKLTNDCFDNCLLCYDDSKKECIVCNNINYSINIINGERHKNCQNQEDEKTEKMTEIFTDKLTDKLIDTITDETIDKLTDKLTNIVTEKPADETTDKLTDTITEQLTDETTDKLSDKVTEKIPDTITDKITDTISDKLIDKTTDKLTDTIIDKITDKLTDKITDRITDKLTDKVTENQKDKKDCTNEEIISSECPHSIVKEDQYEDLDKKVEKEFLSTYDGKEKRIVTENVKFQMKNYTSDDDEDSSISSIDLGECEQDLKTFYDIPKEESLIIYKKDIKSNDLINTYVEYKIYNPLNLQPLDYLTICSKEKISISVPVNLNNGTKTLYNNLNNSGYNLFDANDSFYNDICATYTTQNGTDISLNDRKGLIEESGGSLDFCQEGCTMEYFNYTIQKAKCNCNIEATKNITSLNDIEFTKDLLFNILEGLKYSNYLVMKCYKLLLNFELIKSNIGFIFMAIIFILNLILFFIYIIKGRSKLKYYIQAVLKNKSVYINNMKNLKKQNSSKTNNKTITKNNQKIRSEKNKSLTINKRNSIDKEIKNLKNSSKKNDEKNKKITTKKNKSEPPKKNKNIHFEQESDSSIKNLAKTNGKKNKSGIKNLNINIIPIHNINYAKCKNEQKGKNKQNKKLKIKNIAKTDFNIYKYKDKKNDKKMNEDKPKLKKNEKQKNVLDLDYVNYKTLNIQELNNLEYKIAILIDKRTFFKYYCDLIRKKQLLIVTFIPTDDYNLVSLKISSFLLQFSLYMTINSFFFSDDTMHKIYTDNGEIDFLYHLPQIIYSSLISIITNTILRQLSLSESDILSIKEAKLMEVSNKRAEEVKSLLKIKIICFFIISFILIIFFWYFISCFCAVYTNTQIILIKDSLISFGFSMIYPFGINLIPGIFRMPALRAKKKDKKCIYKFSQLLSLI